jgi:hypothetical protein
VVFSGVVQRERAIAGCLAEHNKEPKPAVVPKENTCLDD